MIFPEGLRIKQFQKKQGLKGKNIAKEANISSAYYSQITTGKKEPTITTVRNIARVLNVSMSEIFDTENERRSRICYERFQRIVFESIKEANRLNE